MTVCAVHTPLPDIFRPDLHIRTTEKDGERTLSIEIDRYADNWEVTWFLQQFGKYRFVMKECDVAAEKRIDEWQLRMHMGRDGSLDEKVADLMPRKFKVRVYIIFHKQVRSAEEMPSFVRLFAGLDEGEIPPEPKRMTRWERLRAPLV